MKPGLICVRETVTEQALYVAPSVTKSVFNTLGQHMGHAIVQKYTASVEEKQEYFGGYYGPIPLGNRSFTLRLIVATENELEAYVQERISQAAVCRHISSYLYATTKLQTKIDAAIAVLES